MQANNEYVEPINSHVGEFEDDWVNLTCMEHKTTEFNKFTIRTAIENLKLGDIFKSKVKLLQVINE